MKFRLSVLTFASLMGYLKCLESNAFPKSKNYYFFKTCTADGYFLIQLNSPDFKRLLVFDTYLYFFFAAASFSLRSF